MLLLPVGRIKRARFLSFVERLRPENVVRLGDISPDGRPNRSEHDVLKPGRPSAPPKALYRFLLIIL
jgi:hypothetical protein